MKYSKCNQHVSSLFVAGRKLIPRGIWRCQCVVTDEASDEGANCLKHGSYEKRVTASDSFDEVQCRDCSCNRDTTEDSLDGKWVESADKRLAPAKFLPIKEAIYSVPALAKNVSP